MYTCVLLILATVFALILIFNHYFGNRKLRKFASCFPGPISLPFVGDAYVFLGMNTEGSSFYKFKFITYSII